MSEGALSAVTNFDWNALLPVVIAIFGFFGGAFTYKWQKSLDRQVARLQSRKELYSEFLAATELAMAKFFKEKKTLEYEETRNIKRLRNEIVLTCPKQVVLCLETFDHVRRSVTEYGKFDENSAAEIRGLFNLMLEEMRKDYHQKPIGFWQSFFNEKYEQIVEDLG